MNTINNEILSAIDNIETVTMEAEMNVLTALCDAYEKSAVILENYTGDDYSCFDIFQEGISDQLNKPVLGEKGENIIKRILMILPRLLNAIVKKLKRTFGNGELIKFKKEIEDLKKEISIIKHSQSRMNSTQNDVLASCSRLTNNTFDLGLNQREISSELSRRIDDLEQSFKDAEEKTNARLNGLKEDLRKNKEDLRKDMNHVTDDHNLLSSAIINLGITAERQTLIIDSMHGVYRCAIDLNGIDQVYENISILLMKINTGIKFKNTNYELLNTIEKEVNQLDGQYMSCVDVVKKYTFDDFKNQMIKLSKRKEEIIDSCNKMIRSCDCELKMYESKHDAQSEQWCRDMKKIIEITNHLSITTIKINNDVYDAFRSIEKHIRWLKKYWDPDNALFVDPDAVDKSYLDLNPDI